ncbi:hypothetical protein FB558_5197 [Pseudonocardia kunmingensis]|uniref:Uncharacterized protein n=1 Tax=Pseudonocardia kunmingensis TaxID=630975 RepID=A0A543DJC4_9PSEU|nr:hypothetical protein FB558_5197 [Pseudonocardia kunmingensis]
MSAAHPVDERRVREPTRGSVPVVGGRSVHEPVVAAALNGQSGT